MKKLNGCVMAALVGGVFTLGAVHGQPESAKAPQQPDKAAAPKKEEASKRIGSAYPFDTCPISGKKLGSMGDPVVKLYEGREVRYCCDGCPPSFEKDLKASFATLDEKITKDQAPLYPTKVSIVSGKDLPAKPVDFVAGNRLVRVASEDEKAEFQKDLKKFIAALDQAVVKQQGENYPLKSCPVSDETLGGMGEVKDVVVAGRLVRLCCNMCKPKLDKEPAKFIAMIDAARKTQATEPKR